MMFHRKSYVKTDEEASVNGTPKGPEPFTCTLSSSVNGRAALILKRELQLSAGWTLAVSDHGDSKASACAGKRAPASPAAENTVLAPDHSVRADKS